MKRSIVPGVAATLALRLCGLGWFAAVGLGACSSSGPATGEPPALSEGDGGTTTDPDPPGPETPGGETPDAGEDPSSGPPDPCAAVAPVCPTTTTTAGSGLVALDRCAFPMQEATSFKTLPPLVDALEKIAPRVTTAALLADLNRTATSTTDIPGSPPGVELAFRWEKEDDDVATWYPQGITGSADANATGLVDGRRVILVSWYYTPPAGSTYEKGVRIAFLDVTNKAATPYRFALLVEPKGSAQAPDFVPVTVHAGGLVWIDNLLYVPDTGRGFRVFDMGRIMRVATDVDQIGCSAGTCRGGLYKYVIPQIGAYSDTSPCSMLFSYVSLDRSTSPPSLLSGEYCGGTSCASKPLAGRAFRWPLDTATGKLRAPKSWPSEAFLLGQQQVQGAASRAGTFYLSSSAPLFGRGELYRVKGTKSATSPFLDAPEDIMIDEKAGLLWSLSEGEGERVVAGMKLTSFPAP